MNAVLNSDDLSAYEEGFHEMFDSLRRGDVRTQALCEELQSLFALSNQGQETITTVRYGPNRAIEGTVAVTRARAQIPAERFVGRMSALVEYARACRAHGCVPQSK